MDMLKDISFETSVDDDGEYPSVFKDIRVAATHQEHGELGSLNAIRICRRFCKGQFLEVMDENSDELHQFSTALFDKYGLVRPWLVNEGVKKGTGCWGHELDKGELVYITDLSIIAPWRGKGIGTLLLQNFLASENVGPKDNVICWPVPTGNWDPITGKDLTKPEWDQAKKRQVRFFQKNLFRRIGRTSFFGYSPDPGHPSRAIPIEADAGPISNEFTPSGPILTNIDDVKTAFPLHFAIANDANPSISDIIQSHYQQDPASIHKPDQSGITPIFVAAGRVNVHAVRKLLDLGVADDLVNCANQDGMTALEKLQDTMLSTREFSETLLNKWDGYSNDELTVQHLLKSAMGIPSNGDANSKWGCSCGQCSDGWLSPRMRFRLKVSAGMSKDNMQFELDRSTFERGKPLWDTEDLVNMEYIPENLRTNVYKTFYMGYQAVFETIHLLLATSAHPLTVSRTASASVGDRNIGYYLSKGGKIEYAIDCVAHSAETESELGDGTFEETFDNGEDDDLGYGALPRCSNDLEFQLVRRMMGLNPMFNWGPYYSFERDDQMILDEDEDDEGLGFVGLSATNFAMLQQMLPSTSLPIRR